ncbi:hypothetical protein KCU98_g7486, partial [Aureobasidium melanogenum]
MPIRVDSLPSTSPIVKSLKLPSKRQRKLLVDHFDFGGAADEVTSSRSDFHNVDLPDMTAIHSDDDDDDDDEDIETSLVSDDESSEDTPGKADTVQPGGKSSPELGILMPVVW